MASQLETTGTLERRLTLSVNPADISSKVQERLRSMAKTTRMPAFRPGKVPVRLIEQSYGPQVHSEVLGEAISRAFSDAVQAENLRVAGQPEIAPKDESQGPNATEFVATFEVYPDVKLGDPATLEVDRYNASVDDKALEATIDVLRKQRTRWIAPARRATVPPSTSWASSTVKPSPAVPPKASRWCWAKAACCPTSKPACWARRLARPSPST